MGNILPFIFALILLQFCIVKAFLNGTPVTTAELTSNSDGSGSVMCGYANWNGSNCLSIQMSHTQAIVPTGVCGSVYQTQPGIITIDPLSSSLAFVNYTSFTNLKTPGIQIMNLQQNMGIGSSPSFNHDPQKSSPPTQGTVCQAYGFNSITSTSYQLTKIVTNVISIQDCQTAWGSLLTVATDGSQFCAYVTTDGTPLGQNAIHSGTDHLNAVAEYPAPIFCQNWLSNRNRGINLNPTLPIGSNQGLNLQLALVNGVIIGVAVNNPNIVGSGPYLFAGFVANSTLIGDSAVRPAVYQYAYDMTPQ